MSEEKLLTVREVSIILGVSEKEVLDLAENSSIPAYKVGGVYLRFKRDQIQEFKKTHRPLSHGPDAHTDYPMKDKVDDFFYFNDFYILTGLLIILLVVIILRGY